jgi:hypothetical protein
MEPTTARQTITDGVWLKLSAGIDQAKHAQAVLRVTSFAGLEAFSYGKTAFASKN